jgi:Putative DNA-binding domain
MSNSLHELLKSSDPLSDEAIVAVISAREENSFVDFKADFENVDREWLEVTKDVMSFANMEGGYLVFGVKNGSYEPVGLRDEIVKLLSDTNNLMHKFNKWVEPPFTTLRAKAIERDGKKFVVVLIPESLGSTHMVSKEGAFKHPSGETKVVLREGTFYVRRSGANHRADSRDLDALIERRMVSNRAKLLEGIARVMAAPPDREVLVVKKQEGGEGAEAKYVIEDAPEGMKGMSFIPTPETIEQEIAMFVGLNKANPTEIPTAKMIWKWYEARDRLKLPVDHKIRVAMFSWRRCAPAFYWIRGCSGEQLREALGEVMRVERDAGVVGDVLVVSAYLGKRFHRSQVAKAGDTSRFRREAAWPLAGARSYWEDGLPRRRDRKEFLKQLDAIVKSATAAWDGQPGVADRLTAQRLDSFLYAQNDYPDSRPEKVAELVR